MEASEIIKLVIACIILVYALIITVVSVRQKLKAKAAAGEEVNIDTVFTEIANSAINFISSAEIAYQALTGATGVKTGEFKLESVLNKIRDICSEKGVVFDKEYWTTFINNTVATMNSVTKTSVQSNGQVEFKAFKENQK